MKNIFLICFCIFIILAVVLYFYVFSAGCCGHTLSAEASRSVEETVKRMQKTVDVVSTNCSGSPNIIKFRLNHTGTLDIESGELYAMLDEKIIKTTPDIQIYSLKAGDLSTEFSYNTFEDNAEVILTVGSPAEEMNERLICS